MVRTGQDSDRKSSEFVLLQSISGIDNAITVRYSVLVAIDKDSVLVAIDKDSVLVAIDKDSVLVAISRITRTRFWPSDQLTAQCSNLLDIM